MADTMVVQKFFNEVLSIKIKLEKGTLLEIVAAAVSAIRS